MSERQEVLRKRYQRCAVLFLVACLLVLWTVGRDRAAENSQYDPDLERKISEAWALDVQHVPPLKIKDVNPKYPVYISGILRRRAHHSDLDDDEISVNFGDCVYTYREQVQFKVDPESGEVQDQGSIFYPNFAKSAPMGAPGGASLRGAVVSEHTLYLMAGWLKLPETMLPLPPPAEGELVAPALGQGDSKLQALRNDSHREWVPLEPNERSHQRDRVNVFLGAERKGGYGYTYNWVYPHQVYYLGGIRNGELVPFKSIGWAGHFRAVARGRPLGRSTSRAEDVFEFSTKPLDLKEIMAHADRNPGYKVDRGDFPHQPPAHPLPYSRTLVAVALGLLSVLSWGLSKVAGKGTPTVDRAEGLGA